MAGAARRSVALAPPPLPPLPSGWSRRFAWRPADSETALAARLQGDRVLMPPEALPELEPLMKQGRPLTFEVTVVGTETRAGAMYAGVLEFSAPEGTVVLPNSLAASLRVEPADVLVFRLVDLPKGTFARLEPLDAAYRRVPDFRWGARTGRNPATTTAANLAASLAARSPYDAGGRAVRSSAMLEAYLRAQFTTLTEGEVIVVRQLERAVPIRVAELKPARAVAIVDTELAVDLEPLADEASGDVSGGGPAPAPAPGSGAAPMAEDAPELKLDAPSVRGHVHDSTAAHWRVRPPALVRLTVEHGDAVLLASQEVEHPSLLDHTWAALDRGATTLLLQAPVAAGLRADAEVYLAVVGLAAGTTFNLKAERAPVPVDPPAAAAGDSGSSRSNHAGSGSAPLLTAPAPGTSQCGNCRQWVPTASRAMHDTFCLRNNSFCPLCETVFLKREAAQHWHCPDCGLLLPDPSDRARHSRLLHSPIACPCGVSLPLERIRQHRRADCPLRSIVCRFCGDRVQAGLPQPGTGFGEHEAYCGSRTVDCPACTQKVAMKVFASHTLLHDLERRRLPLPLTLCRNVCCARPQNPTNPLGLCQFCYSPLYSATHDPTNKMMLQRLLAMYHQQIMRGCGRAGQCHNPVCRTGAAGASNLPAEPNAAAVLALQWIGKSVLGGAPRTTAQYALCVDPVTDRARQRAERLHLLGYPIEWCVKAVDETVKAARKTASADDDDDNDDGRNDDTGDGRTALPDVLVQAANWLQTHAPPPPAAST